MKNMKKLIALFCMSVGVMIISLPMTALASNTPSPWAESYVNQAIFVNIVPANLQSNYTQPITRAEFSALAVALYEVAMGEITGRISFADTTDVNVEKAAYIGIVSGVGNNNFDPNTALTREQAAVMLARLSYAVDRPLPVRAATMANFVDNSDIATWAIESVGKVSATGVMGGVEGNMFAPQQLYTREQAIVTIIRIFEGIRNVGANIPADTNNLRTTPEQNNSHERNEARDRDRNIANSNTEASDRNGNTIDDSAAIAERERATADGNSWGGDGQEAWVHRMIERGYSMEMIEVMIYGPNHPLFEELFGNPNRG